MLRETVYDTIHDAQKHFRIILDTTARPGKILRFDDISITTPDGLCRASALIGFALLNADVSFYLDDYNEEATQYLVVNTASSKTAASEADFLFISGLEGISPIREAKTGTPQYPEGGATIIVEVEKISSDIFPNALSLALSGPGILGQKTVYAKGLDTAMLEEIQIKNQEFPLGVDVIVVDPQDMLFCIPRTTKISWGIGD
jgi:alpha-D-ribose 1-methylphosphonate 5-triphosphate synthase subunit PhnH